MSSDSPAPAVLVVDDDLALGKVLVGLLNQAKLVARHASSAEDALGLIGSYPFDLVITDLKMPRMDGLSLVRELKTRVPDVPVILLTAHGSIPVAVEAMRAGASDFLTKPFDRDEILYTVDKALKLGERALTAPPDPGTRGGTWLGSSQPMTEVADLVRRAARASANVLIRGESGTGKEVVARSIHAESSRKEGPFVAVNCAALPEQLLESELFGHRRGAFTGATSDRKGLLEVAQGGSVLFDEIGEMPLPLQVKILRALQERMVTKVGDTKSDSVDIRVVAATHRNLEQMVKEGTFREDLYYRLNVVQIHLPPLRDRGEDVVVIANFLLQKYAAEQNVKKIKGFAPMALTAIRKYPWPGNVRQLENRLKRAVVLAEGAQVTPEDLDIQSEDLEDILPLQEALERFRRRYIDEALERNANNRTKTARELGVDPRTIFRHLEQTRGATDLGPEDGDA